MPKLLKIALAITILPLCFVLGLWIGPKAGSLYRQWFPPAQYQTGDFAALYAKAGHSVLMYSTTTCPYCEKVRQLFADMQVPYTDYQIDKSQSASEDFERLKANGVPVLFIGDRRIDGYRKQVIVEALAQIGKVPPRPGS